MERAAAFKIIESLRKGIPPDGSIRQFTVGRKHEIEELQRLVQEGCTGVLYIKANFGSGKTHLLRLLREYALAQGYAVSLVGLDAAASVRFNRMDQIAGAVMRGLAVPNFPGDGIRPLFDLVCQRIEESKARGDTDGFWYTLTNRWQWDFSEVCDSPSIFVGIRAWATGLPGVQNLVEDWLFQPWSYYGQRKRLYNELIRNLFRYFRDPRPEWHFYRDTFRFNVQNHDQSWKCLRDLRVLATETGLRGLIILFDEFENMLTGLRRSDYKRDAFWNLLQFGRRKQFPDLSSFAITPGFFRRLAEFVNEMNGCGYDYSELKRYPVFEMQPLEVPQLEELALRIRSTHAVALGWDAEAFISENELRSIVQRSASVGVQDRSRHTIKQIVSALDEVFEEVM